MALTIAQVTDFRTIVPTDTTTDQSIKEGYLVTNTSRAGSGVLVFTTPAGYSPLILGSFIILVYSGTFQTGDYCTLTNGGTFTISTVTTTAHAGIECYGTMSDTDSTLNTNEVLDATETEITVTSSAVTAFKIGDILRIEDTVDEYVYVTRVFNATTIWVRRGLFGTAGTHITTRNLHIVDTDLFEQILDADVAGGWGYSTSTNGRLELNCRIMLGRADIASTNILISSKENLDFSGTTTNFVRAYGGASYRNHTQIGLGFLTSDNEGPAHSGSIISGPREGSGTSQNFRNAGGNTLYLFNASFNCGTRLEGALFLNNSVFSARDDNDVQNFGMLETSQTYNLFMNNGPLLPASEVWTAENTFVWSMFYNIIWVYAFGAVTFKGLIANDESTLGGFISNGQKTLINCNVTPYIGIFFGPGTEFFNYKTFDCNVVDEAGNVLENAQVVCNYRVDKTDNIFDVLTDSNGDTAQQSVLFAYGITSGNGLILTTTDTRYIEFFIRKSGYKELSGRIYIENKDDPIVLKKVLKPNRYIEKQSN